MGSPKRKLVEVKDETRETARGPQTLNPGQLITLLIGPEKKRFYVYKDYACHYSPVLKAALNSTFIEGQTQTYSLEHVAEPVALSLVHWMNRGTLDVDSTMVRGTSIDTTDVDQDLNLVRLWELADQLLIRELQNLVIHTMAAFRDSCNAVPTHTIVYVWENITKGSPLRRFILNQCATYLGEQWYTQHPEQFPVEMLLELVEVFAEFKDVTKLKKAFGFKEKNDLSQYEITEG